MKRIIYTAVALIFCASVFGIADYLNAKKQGTLVNYTDEVQPAERVIPEKKTEVSLTTKEAIQTPGTKKEFKKQTRAEKKVITAKSKEPYYTEIIPNLVVSDEVKEHVAKKAGADNIVLQSKTTDTKNDSAAQTSEKRKIKMEMFSRAPIREKKLKKK